jgi:muramoyltetrapeptide carboxypeptidase LdcA involved in peptidoglycan recycling
MIYPMNLEHGFKVGVTATSAGYDNEVDFRRLESGIKHFEDLGYPVVVTDNVKKSFKGRSSDGQTRAVQLMELFHNPEVRAIIAASGGDYLVEMLPYLDFHVLEENPKWFQGFSDTTGLTFTITTNLDIATLYTNNFGPFGMEHWHPSLFDNLRILEGQDICQNSFDYYQDGFVERVTGLEEYRLDKEVHWKNLNPPNTIDQEIVIKGRALGGCLDVLLNLVGTKYDKTKEFIARYQRDKILWFLESFDLSSEALVRGLWQLKEAGWFEHASGFIFGRPAMYRSEIDVTYEEAVMTVLGELELPVILDADIGHKPPQFTMINGALATVQSKNGKGNILFERR